MSKRPRPTLTKTPYFIGEKTGLDFIKSGCTVLDCALGGGWAISRIANVVGDKSSAKTALATEALANFLTKYPDGGAAYRDCEAAFDIAYAEAMGIPVNQIDFGDPKKPLLTVEDFARDFDKFLDTQIRADAPGIYVLDSLDALSDEAELGADIGKATYGMGKAKSMSIFFRKGIARKIEVSKVLLFIVSQVRENIGVTFGEKYRRAGGKALDFYASQIVWLARVKTLQRTINKVERPYGIVVKAKVKKNKVGFPFREVDFPFLFGYGVEDLAASVLWLKEVSRLNEIDLADREVQPFILGLDKMSDAEYRKEQQRITSVVKKSWAEIETDFLPRRAKYG